MRCEGRRVIEEMLKGELKWWGKGRYREGKVKRGLVQVQ